MSWQSHKVSELTQIWSSTQSLTLVSDLISMSQFIMTESQERKSEKRRNHREKDVKESQEEESKRTKNVKESQRELRERVRGKKMSKRVKKSQERRSKKVKEKESQRGSRKGGPKGGNVKKKKERDSRRKMILMKNQFQKEYWIMSKIRKTEENQTSSILD